MLEPCLGSRLFSEGLDPACSEILDKTGRRLMWVLLDTDPFRLSIPWEWILDRPWIYITIISNKMVPTIGKLTRPTLATPVWFPFKRYAVFTWSDGVHAIFPHQRALISLLRAPSLHPKSTTLSLGGRPSPLPPIAGIPKKKKDGIKIFRPTLLLGLRMIFLFRPCAKWAGQGNHWVRVARLWLKSGCWAYSFNDQTNIELGSIIW